MENGPPTILYVGQHESRRQSPVTNEILGEAQSCGYDILTRPITTDSFQSRILSTLETHVQGPHAASLPEISPFLPIDTDLAPADCNSAFVGVVSPWIDLGSADPLIADVSRQIFQLEVAYAAFCGLSNILLHGPIAGADVVQYARAVLDGLAAGMSVQLYILLPMTGELELEGTDSCHLSELARPQYITEPSEPDEDDDDLESFAAWQVWDTIRNVCNYNSRLGVALEIPRALPSLDLQSRWFSEHVRLLVFPRTSFIRNAKGYPVLSKPQQQLLTQYLRLRYPPWALLADVDPITTPPNEITPDPTPSEAATKPRDKPKDSHAHLRYLRHLQQSQPTRPPVERFGHGYQDYLQSPLQPLTDNLESVTYEVFEKDPIKYEWYERATAAALRDLHEELNRPIIVAVVGAGRGPLVTGALQASQQTGVPIVCCAVEKNPNAHVLIQRRNATDPLWNNRVLIYRSDMRSWPGPLLPDKLEPSKVDILISELLGSFADNELSPECLDGVQHVLHPEHGVNIPQSYSAHLTPIATPRLYADLLHRPGNSTERWETPVVVLLHQYDYLCTLPPATASASEPAGPDVKECWSFEHPITESLLSQNTSNDHNTRACTLKYSSTHGGLCHGLAGYFETILYTPRDASLAPIELSTNPLTMDQKSKDMISWFPIFFPLKTPLSIPADGEIEVRVWRKTDGRMVWYEWFAEVFSHTVGSGKKKKVKTGGTELHSSKVVGCLM